MGGWSFDLRNPDPIGLVITALLVALIPLILHLIIYRSSGSTSLPCFLLAGPSGAGKTSLLLLA